VHLFCLGWPIAVVVCVSVSLASVLVLYLAVRMRLGHRQRRFATGTGDDPHSQMEWEDDFGLNIIVNPLDETKVNRSILSIFTYDFVIFVFVSFIIEM
jgi:hypothetical protein